MLDRAMTPTAFVSPAHGLHYSPPWSTPAARHRALPSRSVPPPLGLLMTQAKAPATAPPHSAGDAPRRKRTREERDAERMKRLGVAPRDEGAWEWSSGWLPRFKPYVNEEGYVVDMWSLSSIKTSHKVLAGVLAFAMLSAFVPPLLPVQTTKVYQGGQLGGGHRDLIRTAAGQMQMWEDLTGKQKTAAELLGFNPKSWNEDGKVPVDKLMWSKLTPVQQRAAGVLQIDKELWNEEVFVDIYERAWSELSPDQRAAAKLLGFKKKSWDQEQHVWSDDVYWKQLTPEQQAAGQDIGYTQEEWDKSRHIFDKSWAKLTREQKSAAKELGYTKDKWNWDKYVEADDLFWKQLSLQQRKAARVLGFKEQDWNRATSAGSHSKDKETERKRGQRDDPNNSFSGAEKEIAHKKPKNPNGCENELQGPFSYSRCKRSSVPYYVPKVMQGTSERATFPFGMGL